MSELKTEIGVIEAIHQRRSVRAFAPEALDPSAIRALLDAAVWAPTAMHEEPWLFVIVQDRAVLKKLSDRAKAIFAAQAAQGHTDPSGRLREIVAQPDFNLFYNAGTLIVICGKPKGPFVVADCWLAAENVLLAAHAMGLATCVIGLAVAGLNAPEIKALLKIPAECTAIAPIIVGKPSGATPATTRAAPDIAYWE